MDTAAKLHLLKGTSSGPEHWPFLVVLPGFKVNWPTFLVIIDHGSWFYYKGFRTCYRKAHTSFYNHVRAQGQSVLIAALITIELNVKTDLIAQLNAEADLKGPWE